jgi:hypothetical protein
MSEREFNRKVCDVQAILIPAAEKAKGHALLPRERQRITTLIRESLADADPRKMQELVALVIPKTTTVRPGFTETTTGKALTEQAPAGAAPQNPLVEERVHAELFQRCQAGRRMFGRGLTTAEEKDLEQAIRERFGESFAKGPGTAAGSSFGRAVMEGKLGSAKCPGLRRPMLQTAAEITEAAAVPGVDAASLHEIGHLPLLGRDECFQDAMTAFAATVPFGAQRLDQSQGR